MRTRKQGTAVRPLLPAFVAVCIGLAPARAAVMVPVGVAEEAVDAQERTYPARIVAVAEVAVRPQVTGEILYVGFRNGQPVRKGDVLYRLDPVKYVAAERNAAAKIVEIKSSLAYAEKQTARYRELVKTRAVPEDDFDHVRAQRDGYRAALAAAEADLAAAQDDVKHCTVVAPIAGRVGSTALTEGNFVTRGGGALVQLVQTDPVRAMFEISSVEYAEAFASDPARIAAEGRVALRRRAGDAAVATGRVEYVENVANAATDAVKVFACVANGDGRLLAGQTVMASLANASGVRRVAVPPNAVALDARGTYVWTVDAAGVARQRRVVRGALQGGRQFIRSGLAAGERIVLDGVHRVKDGDVVTAEK